MPDLHEERRSDQKRTELESSVSEEPEQAFRIRSASMREEPLSCPILPVHNSEDDIQEKPEPLNGKHASETRKEKSGKKESLKFKEWHVTDHVTPVASITEILRRPSLASIGSSPTQSPTRNAPRNSMIRSDTSYEDTAEMPRAGVAAEIGAKGQTGKGPSGYNYGYGYESSDHCSSAQNSPKDPGSPASIGSSRARFNYEESAFSEDGLWMRKSNNDSIWIQFGIVFDIDGVIARGPKPLDPAKRMFKKLAAGGRQLKIPVAFVTNGSGFQETKAKTISSWFDIDVDPEQVILAETPLSVCTSYHNKHVLAVGQDNYLQIAKKLGFNKICSLDDIRKAYPLLDMVDHDRRKAAVKNVPEVHLDRVEAIMMIGEPKQWESYLQILVDLLITNGKPNSPPDHGYPKEHIPILVANMDLQFMDQACIPRFGQGAFLVCIESLYHKITGNDLKYTVMCGKPSEFTFRYAEHIISRMSKKLGITTPIRRMYMLGDNPLVDIVGANLYNRYLDRYRRRAQHLDHPVNEKEIKMLHQQAVIDKFRRPPEDAELGQQTVTRIEGILVGTGVYNPKSNLVNPRVMCMQSHRDVQVDTVLLRPTALVKDCEIALEYILRKECVPPEYLGLSPQADGGAVPRKDSSATMRSLSMSEHDQEQKAAAAAH